MADHEGFPAFDGCQDDGGQHERTLYHQVHIDLPAEAAKRLEAIGITDGMQPDRPVIHPPIGLRMQLTEPAKPQGDK